MLFLLKRAVLSKYNSQNLVGMYYFYTILEEHYTKFYLFGFEISTRHLNKLL